MLGVGPPGLDAALEPALPDLERGVVMASDSCPQPDIHDLSASLNEFESSSLNILAVQLRILTEVL